MIKIGDKLVLKYPERDTIKEAGYAGIQDAIRSRFVAVGDLLTILSTSLTVFGDIRDASLVRVTITNGHEWSISKACFDFPPKFRRKLPDWF